jgi:hypothetical protein
MDWFWRAFWNCAERTGAGLWVEPVNVASGMAFPLAALMLWRLAKSASDPASERVGIAFSILLALVGMGSTAFHLFANGLGLVVDAMFVVIFAHAFLPLFLMRVLRWGKGESILALGVFVAMELAPRFFSVRVIWWHLIALIGLCIIAILSRGASAEIRRRTQLAAGVFAASLLFHVADGPMSQWIPFGTHFLWHLGTAFALYLLGATLIRASARAVAEAIPGDATAEVLPLSTTTAEAR